MEEQEMNTMAEQTAEEQEQPTQQEQTEEAQTTAGSQDNETAEETADSCNNDSQAAEEPADELTALKAQIEELHDKYLRQVAEFDNYRKRTLKERAELILNGGEKTIVALLPVLDDMERAIANGAKTDDPEVLREGMTLIYHKLMKTLETLGVSTIDTTDADFDTDVHEAVAMVPGMGDDKKGKVIDCLTTGYKLNEKVIRHAKVAVGQ